MPDIQNLTITPLANASISVPRFTIAGTVNDSRTGAVLFDFRGANAITFPNFLGTLTAAQRLEVIDLILEYLIHKRTGL